MRLGKAAGADNITPEMILGTVGGGLKRIQKLFMRAWTKEWEDNILVPFHEKGSTMKCENYRALCLSLVMFKL